MKSVVIVGCPFSGTKYMAEVLRQCGISVGHERIEPAGIVSWKVTHWKREDFIEDGVQEPMVILHQVKHPIMAISSIASQLSPGDWRWLGNYARMHHMGYLEEENDILTRSMGLWYYWNKMGEDLTPNTYRIEDVWGWKRLFADVIGIEWKKGYPSIDRHFNRHEKRNIVSWDVLFKRNQVLTALVLNMTRRYSYLQVPESYLGDSYYHFPDNIRLSDENVEKMYGWTGETFYF